MLSDYLDVTEFANSVQEAAVGTYAALLAASSIVPANWGVARSAGFGHGIVVIELYTLPLVSETILAIRSLFVIKGSASPLSNASARFDVSGTDGLQRYNNGSPIAFRTLEDKVGMREE